MDTLIVSGGELSINFIKSIMEKEKISNIIAVDKGLEKLDEIGILPNIIVGDFDSARQEVLKKYNKTKIIKLNPKKDFSDTHMALKLAIELKSKDICIIGALGKRTDHALANINILKEALDKNIQCKILDENNEIQLIDKHIELENDKNYKYISLIPLTTQVKGVTLKGLKYLLNNATLNIGDSIGISNEQIDKYATIDIENGILILIKSRD